MTDGIRNGALQRLNDLERRMSVVEQDARQITDLRIAVAKITGAIKGLSQDLQETRDDIAAERRDRSQAVQEQRKTSLGEKAMIYGAGGVIVAAIIQAVSQLAGG